MEPDRISKSLAIHMLGRVGSWEKALKLYDSVNKASQDEALLLEVMSCLTRNSQADKSVELYEARCNEVNQPSAALYTAVIIALIEMEDYEQMNRIYKKAIKSFPDDAILRYSWERGTRKKNGEAENLQGSLHDKEKMSTDFRELLRLASSSGDYRYRSINSCYVC